LLFFGLFPLALPGKGLIVLFFGIFLLFFGIFFCCPLPPETFSADAFGGCSSISVTLFNSFTGIKHKLTKQENGKRWLSQNYKEFQNDINFINAIIAGRIIV